MILLRPYFLLLLCLPFLFWLNAKVYAKSGAWAAICDAHLLPYLTVDVGGKKSKLYRILMLVVWCLVSIALSGPAILKQNVQTGSMQSGLVVVVDMSPAMDEKVKEQVVHKLYDLVAYEKDLTIGLVLSDAKAYTALPLTQDKSILKNIIPTLKENIMPLQGENIVAGINLAGQLLAQSGFKKGRVLLLTAGVSDEEKVVNAIQKSPYPVSVIGVGDRRENGPVFLPNGSFWNDGKMVGLSKMQKLLGQDFMFATIDEKDLKNLLDNKRFEQSQRTDFFATQYQDLGIWLIVLVLPFVVLLFRKGVLFCLMLVLFSAPARASFWWRSEQEDYQTQMQAIADFNLGHYENALNEFQAVYKSNIEALYNMGNTLAYMGKINEAIKAYEDVLKQNPKHEDAAFNLEYLKRQQASSKNESGGESQSEQSKQNQSEEQSGKNTENQSQTMDQQSKQTDQGSGQSQSAEGDEQQDETEQENDDDNSNSSSSEKQKENNAEQQRQSEVLLSDGENKEEGNEEQSVMASDQKQKEWLDRINSDAGRVLRYRLIKQYEAQK